LRRALFCLPLDLRFIREICRFAAPESINAKAHLRLRPSSAWRTRAAFGESRCAGPAGEYDGRCENQGRAAELEDAREPEMGADQTAAQRADERPEEGGAARQSERAAAMLRGDAAGDERIRERNDAREENAGYESFGDERQIIRREPLHEREQR